MFGPAIDFVYCNLSNTLELQSKVLDGRSRSWEESKTQSGSWVHYNPVGKWKQIYLQNYKSCAMSQRSKGFPNDGSAGKESTCNAGDTGDVGSIPGSGRSPGGRNDNPLQYSLWKIPLTEKAGGLPSVRDD